MKAGGVNIYVIWNVSMLDSDVFEMVLIMNGIMGLCVSYGIDYEYMVLVELFNRCCVCYSKKHNAFDRAWLCYQIRFGVWLSTLGWSQMRFGWWVRCALISYTVSHTTEVCLFGVRDGLTQINKTTHYHQIFFHLRLSTSMHLKRCETFF